MMLFIKYLTKDILRKMFSPRLFFTSKIEGLKVGAPSIEQVTTINGQWAFMYPDIYGESLLHSYDE